MAVGRKTLWEALEEIPDRGRKGRQYPLPSVLVPALSAMLSGANGLMAIFRWGCGSRCWSATLGASSRALRGAMPSTGSSDASGATRRFNTDRHPSYNEDDHTVREA